MTVTGGKWTTYRAMAEDVLEQCFDAKLLPRRAAGATENLPLAGAPSPLGGGRGTPRPGADRHVAISQAPGEHLYGSDAAVLHELPGAQRWLWRCEGAETRGLSEAMVRFAVRHEMARSVEDVLARRSRVLFLDAARAEALAEPVAAILADELGPDFDAPASQTSFEALAAQYLRLP